LTSKLGAVPVPTIGAGSGTGAFVAALEQAGFQVVHIKGGFTDATHNIPASPAGELIQVRYLRTVLSSVAGTAQQFDDSTSALLSGLNPSANLNGSLNYGADVILDLVMGL